MLLLYHAFSLGQDSNRPFSPFFRGREKNFLRFLLRPGILKGKNSPQEGEDKEGITMLPPVPMHVIATMHSAFPTKFGIPRAERPGV